MRKYFFYILSFALIACNKTQVDIEKNITKNKVEIPNIQKNKLDALFKLNNGILYFDNEPFSGVVNDYYNNGNIKSKSEYYKGKRAGRYFGFYASGKKWFERYYKNGIKIDVHKGWYEDGQPMFEYFLENGTYNGSVKDWFPNGILAKSFHFKNGVEEGSQKMWDETGKIKANFYTVNGERHGLIGLKNCVSVYNK